MNVRHRRFARLVALTVVVSMPLLGMAGVASAASKAGPNCVKHPNKPKCLNKGGGSGGGTGGTGPGTTQIAITISPNPLVETGASEIHAVIEVGALPNFAGDAVNIDSSQLSASCLNGVTYENLQLGGTTGSPHTSTNSISVIFDNDANATVVVDGTDCAPGTDVVEADLEVAPFVTVLSTLVVNPPIVTPVGLSGYPQVGGVAQEVETGDTSTSGDSNIYAVFYVEENPVYAEQKVEIDSTQLDARCILGWRWEPGNLTVVGLGGFTSPGAIAGTGPNTGAEATTVLDDDGNAVFVFKGTSCASGPSQVIADVLAGTGDTFVTTFTVNPPAPTV